MPFEQLRKDLYNQIDTIQTEYYVYTFYETGDAGTIPRYVGKGKGYRALQHLQKSSNWRLRQLVKRCRNGEVAIAVGVLPVESEQAAFAREKELIEQHGRADPAFITKYLRENAPPQYVVKHGTLFNDTNGGEGTSGIWTLERSHQRCVAGMESLQEKKARSFGRRNIKPKQKKLASV